jgi:flavin-dependent dehydrogenase
MGTEPALVSGHLAGTVAAEAYRQRDYSVRLLGSYQRLWDNTYGRTYRQGALLAPVMWRRTEADWDQQIPLLRRLSSEQMVARLRANWPFSQWRQAAFIRAYYEAGRVRHGVMAGLRSCLQRGRNRVTGT